MPDRRWDVQHLHLDLEIDPRARTVSGTSTHTVLPLGRPDGWLRLHAVGLDVTEVRVDGEPVEGWRIGQETLDVPVPPGPGERTVRVAWSVQPELGLYFRGGRDTPDAVIEAWTQGEGEDHRYWFPGWDHPSDRFTTSSTLTVPDGLLAFSNGVLEGSEPAREGWTRWSYRMDQPIVNYLVAVAVGEYAVWEEEGEVPLAYVAPKGVPEAVVRRSLGAVARQMPFFGDLLGTRYPYPLYRQVVVQRFLYGAMENTTTTLTGEHLLVPDGAQGRRAESIAAHELAHHWFGDLLTCYGWRELWLNEGFASYYARRWMEHAHGPEYGAVQHERHLKAAIGVEAPMAARGWSKGDGGDHAGVYVKGASVLHLLAHTLGQDVFDAGIRAYVARNADRLVETDDLRRALEDVSGTHLGWLFDQWVHGEGIPSFTTSWRHDGESLVVVLRQTTEGEAFHAPVTVEVGTADDVLSRRVWLGPGETRLVVDLDAPPRWVAVDPVGAVPARWAHDQPAAAWVAQLRESPTPYARLVAMDALAAGEASSHAVGSLRSVLLDRSLDPWFRGRAATALGALGGERPTAILVEATSDPEGPVREAAVEALGSGGRVEPAVLERALRDGDREVRAAAIRALGTRDPQRGLRAARRVLSSAFPPYAQPEHAAAAAVVGTHGEGPADLRRLLAQMNADTPRDARQAAAHASAKVLVRMDEGLRERWRGDLSRALEAMTDDPDLQIRRAGIALLGTVGDQAAEPRLRELAHRTRVSELRDAARDAAARIRARGREDARSPQVEDEDALLERIEALEERIRRLEEWR